MTNDALAVPEFRMPEAYYLEGGKYVPNDHVPLLWSQANLWLAVHQMQLSVCPEHTECQVTPEV